MKKLSIIISLVLIFTILFNFVVPTTKVYADFVIAPLATKIIITVLASMGILSTVKNVCPIDAFVDGFKNWYETTTGVTTLFRDLALSGILDMYNGAKTKVTELTQALSNYYDSLWIPEYGLSNEFINYHYEGSDLVSNLEDNISNWPQSGRTYIFQSQSTLIEGTGEFTGFVWDFNLSARYDTSDRKYFFMLYMKEFYNGKKLKDESWRQPFGPLFNIAGYINMSMNAVFEDNIFKGYLSVYNVSNGENFVNRYNIAEIVPGSYLGNRFFNLVNYLNNYPIEWNKSISHYPDDIAIPWGKIADIEVGASTETIEQNLVNANNDNLILYLEEIKEGINALSPTKVVADDGVVTDVLEGEIGEIIEGQETQTSFLANIWIFLKNMFKLPDSMTLDFEPLMNINIQEKFPFSLPWDISRVVNVLLADEKAPEWEVPINGEVLVLDFSIFGAWANIIKSFSFLTFALALILLTRKIIGG